MDHGLAGLERFDLKTFSFSQIPFKLQSNEADLVVTNWGCQGYEFADMKLGEFAHCAQPKGFQPRYIWTRYPLPTTRMWNLLVVFDPPAYAAFFTSLTLTAAVMQLYTALGSRLGLDSASEELILLPLA